MRATIMEAHTHDLLNRAIAAGQAKVSDITVEGANASFVAWLKGGEVVVRRATGDTALPVYRTYYIVRAALEALGYPADDAEMMADVGRHHGETAFETLRSILEA